MLCFVSTWFFMFLARNDFPHASHFTKSPGAGGGGARVGGHDGAGADGPDGTEADGAGADGAGVDDADGAGADVAGVDDADGRWKDREATATAGAGSGSDSLGEGDRELMTMTGGSAACAEVAPTVLAAGNRSRGGTEAAKRGTVLGAVKDTSGNSESESVCSFSFSVA